MREQSRIKVLNGMIEREVSVTEAADLLLMSSENVRPIGLRKCPIRRTLPPQNLVSQLRH